MLDSEGRQIVSDDDGGEERNFRVAPLLWPGECLARVAPWVSSPGQSESGSYNLHAERTPASIARLPLDGSSKQGVIEAGEGADYFQIEVTELTQAVLYTSGSLDTAGVLVGSNGEEVAFNDDGAEQFINLRIATILLHPDECFLRVFSSSGSPGSYTVHVEGAAAH